MTLETPPPTLASLLSSFEQLIRDLQDQGCRTVPCSAPLPSVAQPVNSARWETSPVRPEPVQTPEASCTETDPILAAAPESPLPETLALLVMERLPECLGNRPPEDTRILLVLEPGELRDEKNRDLLQSMLYAVGYPLPNASAPLAELGRLSATAQRIVCMGEAANEHLCTVKMGLNLVRGKWQDTPAGRMIATFPPSYLHDNPTGKRAAWSDLQKILEDMGLSMPEWTRKKLSK